MERQKPSIFNDIVGPVMVGPSSSHTCGPSRIGYLSQQILQGTLKKAHVEFAKDGAYALMYKGQRSDMGFINGLLGNRPEDIALRDAYKLAKERAVDVIFALSDFPPLVPNIAHLTLENTEGHTVVIHSDSTGGGTVKILQINGFDVNIVGDCYELLIWLDTEYNYTTLKKQLEAIFPNAESISLSLNASKGLVNIKLREPCSEIHGADILALAGVFAFQEIAPILLVLSNRHVLLPFTSAEELLLLARQTGKALWELAIEYEMARSGWTAQQVMDQMYTVVATMEAGVHEALRGNISMHGILQPTAGKINVALQQGSNTLDMGVLNTAVPWAMAAMECSSSMGIVHCAPTGGSAGVFPGAVLGVAKHMNCSLEDIVKAMFTTAIVGIVISKDYNYSAELYGCQVEPGAASGMAAAGLIFLMGGTPEQALSAASCAIQNILGTICDPVAGLVQLPCINRNAMSTANAVVCANMIIGGFDPLIPLDQTAETLFRVGKQLPSELRCTCKGGLCITESGQQLAREQDIRDNARL